MTLMGHLLEVRRRLTLAASGVLLGAVVGWLASDLVWAALSGPILDAAVHQDRTAAINYQGVTSAFDLKLQLAIYLGVVLSSPIWLYQIFAFFVPAMTRRERRYAFGFVGVSVPLFAAGCWAGWWVFPHIVELMTGFAPTGSTSLLNARDYFDFAMKLIVASGVAFVLPVVVVILNFVGVVSALAIRRSWRVAIVLITLFTAIATPAADVMSMFVLACPMVLLYLIAVAVTTLHDRRAERASRDLEASLSEVA
jgi:sec-independent protein translocase protein TatC